MDQITTHKKAIREWLTSGKSITPIDALNMFGCFRLGARIKDLRDEGLFIVTGWEEAVSTKTGRPVRYARYYIPKQEMKASLA